jgi:hypothetical protein
LLDDRVAQDELFDDFLVFENVAWIGFVDRRGNIRNFLPFDLKASDEEQLERISETVIPNNAMVAARWYLRGRRPGRRPTESRSSGRRSKLSSAQKADG